MIMRHIAIYFSEPAATQSPFPDEEYLVSYKDFARLVIKKGGTLSVARGIGSFLGHGTFSSGWRFDGTTFEHIADPFTVDLVFNKGTDFPDDGTWTINHPDLYKICIKDRTYELFSVFCPKTIPILLPEELEAALDQTSTDTVVVKPMDSMGGRNVFIGTKQDCLKQQHRYPALVQEFIDTSLGIPGIISAHHDLRIIFVGNTIADCYVRTPPPGKLTANVTQGGAIKQIPIASIPAEAIDIARTIDRKLQRFTDRVYCCDMGLHQGREWKLFELNSPPGHPTYTEGNTLPFYDLLSDHLLKVERTPE